MVFHHFRWIHNELTGFFSSLKAQLSTSTAPRPPAALSLSVSPLPSNPLPSPYDAEPSIVLLPQCAPFARAPHAHSPHPMLLVYDHPPFNGPHQSRPPRAAAVIYRGLSSTTQPPRPPHSSHYSLSGPPHAPCGVLRVGAIPSASAGPTNRWISDELPLHHLDSAYDGHVPTTQTQNHDFPRYSPEIFAHRSDLITSH
jgi:hypothetical protein